MEARFELSTRPENKLGTDEEWDFTEGALQAALERRGIDYHVNEGDGAFYGPKIDLHMTDVLGRSWQMGTIQLDAQMPARFGLTYMGQDNAEHTPYVVHRALLGSLERFIGILDRALRRGVPGLARARAGAADPGRRGASRCGRRASRPHRRSAGCRADVDERDETLSKRIRDAELEKIPYVVVYGDRESEDSLAVRERGGGQSTRSLAALVAGSSGVRLLRSDPAKQERTRPSPPGHEFAGVQPSRRTTRNRAAACSGFCRSEGGARSLVKSL